MSRNRLHQPRWRLIAVSVLSWRQTLKTHDGFLDLSDLRPTILVAPICSQTGLQLLDLGLVGRRFSSLATDQLAKPAPLLVVLLPCRSTKHLQLSIRSAGSVTVRRAGMARDSSAQRWIDGLSDFALRS
ncbi:hypothetical protein HXV84_00105 [Pseudomonas amygdali pv. morsprunorum]|nr:hypothetical protein [Pseudomonas amygdali pv. morsprunorum]